MNLLVVNDLHLQFGNNIIINELNITIKEGEFVSILGPSGSGKSTFFHTIGGILTPQSGSITLHNKLITGKRGFISYMPQTPSLFPWRSVLQNVLLGQELQGKRNTDLALEMLNKAGLSSYVHSYPHELSGGMKQRVAFIRALLSPQSIICLDEPFSALDELTRSDMQNWLLSIWETYKKTILFVTHNIEEALYLSDRIIVLSERPAKVKAEFQVPFSRPRKEHLILEESFLQWKREIYYSIKNSRGDMKYVSND